MKVGRYTAQGSIPCAEHQAHALAKERLEHESREVCRVSRSKPFASPQDEWVHQIYEVKFTKPSVASCSASWYAFCGDTQDTGDGLDTRIGEEK